MKVFGFAEENLPIRFPLIMNSPLSSSSVLTRIQLSTGLTAFKCPETLGIFIPISSYARWLSKQAPSESPALDEISIEHDSSTNSTRALICPESGALMQRYRVIADTPFFVDRSPSGSIWLDKGEWESLESVHLDKHLNRIFTNTWQGSIRQKETDMNRTQLYKSKLGEDLYHQVVSMANEHREHPYRGMIITLFTEVAASIKN